jgi:E3 ubiquitin-protein ligase mind-bomb
LLGKVGTIHRVTERGDFRVKYDSDSNIRWTVYAFALNLIDALYLPGSYVMINEDEKIVSHVQKANKMWSDDIKEVKKTSAKVEIRLLLFQIILDNWQTMQN